MTKKRITKEPEVRRQELLTIGLKLYPQYGDSISVQQVVQTADVATGLFYYYFKSKSQFIEEVLNYYIEQEVQEFLKLLTQDELSAEEKLTQLLQAFRQYVIQVSDYRDHQAYHSLHHYQISERLLQELQPFVQAWIQQGIDEQVFECANPSLTAGFILNGLLVFFQPDFAITKERFEYLEQLIKQLLKGR